MRIYIPLWLDLLSFILILEGLILSHLHSTMVRFIIFVSRCSRLTVNYLHSTMVRFIILGLAYIKADTL